MPWGDGTGPWGLGPMTGRAMGYCAGYPVPGYMNPGFGFGRGFRRFWGRGFGRGFGWRRWRFISPYVPSTTRVRAPVAWEPVQQPYQPTKEEELQLLEDEKKAIEEEQETLRQELEQIRKRIDELKRRK